MRKVLIVLVLVVFAVAGCKSTTGKTASETVDDAYIVSAINGKILGDPDLKFLQITVGSFEGKVTLSGRVPSTAAEAKLVRMAKETKGVKEVADNLTVATQQGTP